MPGLYRCTELFRNIAVGVNDQIPNDSDAVKTSSEKGTVALFVP
jgi:hypothetical protein